MKIVVGLGNPGVQYASTPHNIGFEAVDLLARELALDWQEKRQYKCLWTKGRIGAEPVILVKPQTFMNLSGESVAAVVRYSNCRPCDLIVIQDDIDMPLGRLRVRVGGSCGGHNGIRNIIERLGSPAFVRVKIGVGKDKSDVVRHVLGKFDPKSREVADKAAVAAVKAVEAAVLHGSDRAMNLFNGWSAAAEK